MNRYHLYHLVLLASTVSCASLIAQNQQHPISTTNIYYYNSSLPTQVPKPKIGDQVIPETNPARTSNEQAMRAMGYQPPVIPPSDPAALHQFLISQYNAENGGIPDSEAKKHLLDIMNEMHASDRKQLDSRSQVLPAYKDAYVQIKSMLEGTSPLSFIEASYLMEAAYGSPYMSYKEYKAAINQSASFIKQWLQEKNYPATPQNLHYAIQQFMGDTLQVTTTLADDKQQAKRTTHYPFRYDYEDYEGKQDYRNYFSTKCWATGTGQCNSMPMIYLHLCEALNVQGYLSFAPFHSFVKFRNKDGKLINYEPTSHWTIPDKWYQDNLGVTQKAKTRGIYLDTLNKKQAVANTLVDLAISYVLNTSKPDTAFVQQCLTTAQKSFPRDNNVYLYLAKSCLLSRQLDDALRQHGVKDLNEASKYPDTDVLYMQLMENETILHSLGYEPLLQSMYDDLIAHQQNRVNAPDAKTKKSLFKKTK